MQHEFDAQHSKKTATGVHGYDPHGDMQWLAYLGPKVVESYDGTRDKQGGIREV